MFEPEIRNYLLTHSNGRLLLGNALGLVRHGLLAANDVAAFFRLAYSEALTAAAGGPVTTDAFEDQLHFLRFEDRLGRPISLGYPFEACPDLSGQTLYTVMPFKYLGAYVPTTASMRNKLDLPMLEAPVDEIAFRLAWEKLTPRQRRFRPSQPLGRSVIWITDEAAIVAALAARRPPDWSEADVLINLLGLGHYPRNRWAVLFSLPGTAIQRSGHYRPTFADSVRGRFFMALSSQTPSLAGEWGQTADLSKLSLPSYDGAVERVARPISLKDDELVEVELLNAVTQNDLDPDLAPQPLSDGVWRRRR